jgi:hypothetical protein
VSALGSSSFRVADVPAGLDDVVAVAAGGYHSLALRADGTVVGWPAHDGRLVPPAGLDGVLAIAAGSFFSLALVSEPPVDPPPEGVCPAPRDPPVFRDVASSNVHAHAIDCAASHDIARGYTDRTYRPHESVRRDHMASFVVRALQAAGHTLPAAEHRFSDVAGNAHEAAIGQLAAAGIVRGQTATSYAPDALVTRDQMASYLVRATDWALDTTHTATDSPFTDVAGNAHERAIHTAYDLGLVSGRTETTYAPRMEVRRDQMASFLVRLLPVTMRTD